MKKWLATLLLLLTTYAGASTFVPTTKQAFPTRNDVATTVGNGRYFTEATMSTLMAKFGQNSFVANGLTLPASSGNLNIVISGGYAFVQGYMVNVGSNTTLTLAASNTNYIFLELPVTSSLVSNVQFTVNTTGTPPSTNSLLLATAVCSGSAITSCLDSRVTSPFIYNKQRIAVYTATGTFTAPGDCNTVTAYMLGGAGGSGPGGCSTCSGGGAQNSGVGGGGGGAGGFTQTTMSVTPGTVYTVTVGAAGSAGAAAPSQTNGGNGTDTWFSLSTIKAVGGTGGNSAANSGTGGAGGTGLPNSSTTLGITGDAGAAQSAGTGGAGGTAYSPYSHGNSLGYGSGGRGGSSTTTPGNPGVIGTAGLCIIYY